MDKQLPYGLAIDEYNNLGSLTCGYVCRLGRISQTRNNGVHYYSVDGQGSVRQLTDANGDVTDSWTFDAFGNAINRSGTTENSFLYDGEALDPNSGWYYLRARHMDPTTGRFTSVDPYNGDPFAPVSLHRYMYANTSPMSYTDPSGKVTLMELQVANSIRGILSEIHLNLMNSVIQKGNGDNDEEVAVNYFLGVAFSGALRFVAVPSVGLKFRKFTRGNMNENLYRLTGIKPPGADAHHLLPVEHIDRFIAAGFKEEDIHNPIFATWWEASEHRSKWSEYSRLWADFFAEGPKSVADCLGKARELAAEYGLTTYF